jgi:hypothetical protein
VGCGFPYYLNPLVYQKILSSRRGEVDIMSITAIPTVLDFIGGFDSSLMISRLYIGLLLSVKE